MPTRHLLILVILLIPFTSAFAQDPRQADGSIIEIMRVAFEYLRDEGEIRADRIVIEEWTEEELDPAVRARLHPRMTTAEEAQQLARELGLPTGDRSMIRCDGPGRVKSLSRCWIEGADAIVSFRRPVASEDADTVTIWVHWDAQTSTPAPDSSERVYSQGVQLELVRRGSTWVVMQKLVTTYHG